MKEQGVGLSLQPLRLVARGLGRFLRSPVGGSAKWLLASLLLLMLAINGMNVLNSYVGRYFMSAIERRQGDKFIQYAWLYVGVFAGSTLVGVLFRFTEERLGLLWREWLTLRASRLYMDARVYLHLEELGSISNPDQRMSEDIRALTITTLSFVLMILNGTVTAISFSGVLWAISPTLFVVAVGYAVAGSLLTIKLGRPLVKLNYQQADREANFRTELIRVRENADGIALTGNEARVRDRLLERVNQIVTNLKHIISVNRNLNFFTTGYNYFIQLIPSLFVAPLFIRGQVEFGVIGQAAMAFATLLGAFSIIITQFQAISAYGSVVARLSEFVGAVESAGAKGATLGLVTPSATERIRYADLTLNAADGEHHPLLKNLTVILQSGRQVLVGGPNDYAKQALFRATAGLYSLGQGTIECPPPDQVTFLPQRPYVPSGTLRELLAPSRTDLEVTDAEILQALRDVGLASVVAKCETTDTSRNWNDVLTLGEQQLMSVARLLLSGSRFAFLDRLDSALSEDVHRKVLHLLADRGVACISFGNAKPDVFMHDAMLTLNMDGSWSWSELHVKEAMRNEAVST